MPTEPIILVAGDTEPPLDLVLRRRGQPINVTGAASLEARIEREGNTTITRPLAVVNGPAGLVRLTWQPGDLDDNAGQPADYRLEATVDGATNAVPYRFTVRPRIT